MKTKIYDIQKFNDQAMAHIKEAADILKKGGLVAFPTETVYGLGADALNPQAVAAIYATKGRPSDNPMIVHVAGMDQLYELSSLQSEVITKLTKRFWPGPLTLVLPKKEKVPDVTTGGLSTIAIRMPDHPVALELIKQSGCPIAAPSANLSGRPSPTKGDHVIEDLNGKIPMILKGGNCRVGIESTVLDLTSEIPTILRPGILTQGDLEMVIGDKVVLDPALDRKKHQEILSPKAPGMKYTHYAPKAEMIVIRGNQDRVRIEIERLKKVNEEKGRIVGVILFEEQAFRQAAHDFFAKLRLLDDQGVDLILAGALNDENPIGFAVMNRMLKSAGYHIIEV
ncbi:MAG: L-threonylcarbamoyladenylate synthase [Eubacteriales bacterium]|nr:L-threonylcarbamoyladenylate synthase [Eubacteriales bacterium]